LLVKYVVNVLKRDGWEMIHAHSPKTKRQEIITPYERVYSDLKGQFRDYLPDVKSMKKYL